MDSINLFVPGRLCLFGEHSDWASEMAANNKGCTIVSGIEQGIYAKATKSSLFTFYYESRKISTKMELGDLRTRFDDEFFKYVCGSVFVVLEKYPISGIEINIIKNDLPIQKGLSSSAAICILVIRAFNKLYNLNLSIEQEMDLAYKAEHLVGSKCGKMDQICAYGSNNVNVMYYENGNIDIKNLKVKGIFTFLIVDLNSKKNTSKILNDLRQAYATNDDLREYLNNTNLDVCNKAIKYLEEGDAYNLGKLMTETQKLFDLNCSKYSDELLAPLLHSILNDLTILEHIYGGKCVGSGGDGTVQLLVKSDNDAIWLINYIKSKYGMTSYKLTIKEQYKLNKAVIPVAGYGTRMYPMTKVINKEFLPILDKDKILKPSICVLIEELYDAGIDEIILLIGKEDIELYKSLFYTNYDIYCTGKTKEMVEYGELKFRYIARKLKFVIVEKGLGFAKTVLECKRVVGSSPFLLALGDQIYQSNSNKSCTKQLIEFYENTGNMTISCSPINKEKASLYGILSGMPEGKNHFKLTSFVEKPKDIDNLIVKVNGSDAVLAVFGEYILTSEIFEKIENNNFESITESINQIKNETTVNGFIVNGKFLDIGNIDGYCEAFNHFYMKNK